MAFYTAWTEALQASRLWLEDAGTQMLNPGNYSKLTGMLNYLSSPLAPNIIQKLEDDSALMGVYRPIQVRYVPHKGTGNLITSDASSTCSKVAQRRDILTTLQPTLYAEDKFTIEENYVRDNSEGSRGKMQARLNKEIQDSMRVVRESIDQQLFTKAAAGFGSNPAQGTGAGNYTTITTTIASSGKIDDNFFDAIKNDQEDNFMNGEVAIVGLGNRTGGPRKLMNRLAVGNANDAGIDYRLVASEFGMVLFKDSFTTSVLSNANRALAIYPGACQLFNYNLYAGMDFKEAHGNVITKTVLPDPIFPNLKYDFQLYYNDNCSTGNGQQAAYVGRIWAYFDLFIVPEGAFGDVYGSLNDFNGILGYLFSES